MKTKLNIGVNLSKNFQKIILEMHEEEIEYNSEEELKGKIRQKFELLNKEAELELDKILNKIK